MKGRSGSGVILRSALMTAALAIIIVLKPWVYEARGKSDDLLSFTEPELRRIRSFGPWPLAASPDPSNRVSGRPDAIALGERLFFSPRLSGSSSLLCASCHVPWRHGTDGRARALGLREVDRNTPTLENVRLQRWFGWDGANDSLWAQSVRPMLDAREMGSSAPNVAALLRGDAELAGMYGRAFGAGIPADDEAVLVDVGKALAAFQETLSSERTPFDDFRDALARGDLKLAAGYPLEAQRGLRLFIGKANCATCHAGPAFSNGEFHDTGITYFIAGGGVDAGRHGGIQKLLANRHNLLGRFNDDPSRATATSTRHVALQPRNFGEFRTPGLRNVALTAPYMHNGSLPTLCAVADHYSEINEDRLHADGERILKPLRLSPGEKNDLVAFLRSLSSKGSELPDERCASAH